MKKLTILSALILLLISVLTISYGTENSIQNSIITTQNNFHGFEIWRYDPDKKTFQKTSSNILSYVDNEYYEKYRHDGFLLSSFGMPIIKDLDDDGINELITIDKFGIVVCGILPKYYPFKEAGWIGRPNILVEDIDLDGDYEIITQRSVSVDKERYSGKRLIQIWMIENDQLKEIWHQFFPGESTYCLLYEDTDNDGEKELITASDTITILKKKNIFDWTVAADLPNIGHPYIEFTLVDVVRVADVDSDGKNEILATGNSGALTVYKHRKQISTGNNSYPVMWQSSSLVSKDGETTNKKRMPVAFTQGLGIGDVDNDSQNEILVGTMELGNFPSRKSRSGGKIHIFKYKGDREFQELWISDWTTSALIPAIAIGDVDGDQINEFIYNGQEVYKYSDQDSQYKKIGILNTNARGAIIGKVSVIQEPKASRRIIPITCDIYLKALKPGQTYNTTIALKNVWSKSYNVFLSLKSENDFICFENGNQKIGIMERGEIVISGPIIVRVDKNIPKEYQGTIYPAIWIEISASEEYKQSIPLTLWLELNK